MPRVLEVPLLEPDSVLMIDAAMDLPDDPTELCQLLANEKCAAKWWLAVVAAYAEKGALAPAITVAQTALEQCAEVKQDTDRAPFHALISWLHLADMRGAATGDKRAHYDAALENGNRAFQQYQSTHADAQTLSIPATLAQGALYSAVGNVAEAARCFDHVLAVQPRNMYARLGRARVLFIRHNFRAALRTFQDVLRQSAHKLDTETREGKNKSSQLARVAGCARLGIGICLWKLGDAVKACKAWTRAAHLAQQIDQPSPNGHTIEGTAETLLGIVALEEAHNGTRASFAAHYTAAINHFQKAYKLGTVALPALKISSYLFSRHDMSSVNKLTDKALEVATHPDLMGEALFWKARAAHYAGDLELALTLYSQSAQTYSPESYPANVAATVGAAIVEHSLDRASDALLTLELLLQQQQSTQAQVRQPGRWNRPRGPDAVQLYAGLLNATVPSGNRKKALALLEQYVARARMYHEPACAEALIALAQLCEPHDRAAAAAHLRTAQAQLRVAHPRVRTNLGTLLFALHEYEEAALQFSTALNEEHPAELETLLKYNLARTNEALGKDQTAEYAALNTVEARARLSLAPNGGREIAQKLLEEYPTNLEIRALQCYHLRRKINAANAGDIPALAEAEQALIKSTLVEHDKHDGYALVALGNIYLHNARVVRDKQRRTRAAKRACELFSKALQYDRQNAYAAQGLAIVLAINKHAKAAVPVFSRLRESISDIATTVNAAHCFVRVRDYARACELYELAAQRAPSSDISNLLAFSWLTYGLRLRDPVQITNALEWAQRALQQHIETPAEGSHNERWQRQKKLLEFNVAFVAVQLGDAVQRKPVEQRTAQQLTDTERDVRAAAAKLNNFATDPQYLPFSASDLEQCADHAENTVLPKLAAAIAEQHEHEERVEARKRAAVQQREEELRLAAAAREHEEELRRARELELAEERQRLQAQTLEWEAEREAQRELERERDGADGKPTKRSKKSKRSRRKESDNEVSDREASDEEPNIDLPDDNEDSDNDVPNGSPEHVKGADANGADANDADANGADADSDANIEKVDRRKAVVDDDNSDDNLF